MAIDVESNMPVEDMVSESIGVDVLFVADSAKSLMHRRGSLIQSMRQKGLSVVALVPRHDCRSDAEALGINIITFELDYHFTRPCHLLKQFGKLVSLIRQIMPKAVVVDAIKSVVMDTLAVRMAGITNIYCLVTGLSHNLIEDQPNARRSHRGAMLFYGLAGSLSRLMIFQDPAELKEFERNRLLYRYSAKRVVNGLGIDLERYAFSPVSVNPVVFLCLAPLVREKGVREFVDAAKVIGHQFPEAKFQIAGIQHRGLANSIGAEEIAEWEAGGVVEFKQEVGDDVTLLTHCSVMVLPSYCEGDSRDIIKAMSCGRAIIACDVAGCPTPVVDGINGFLVKPKNSETLAEAMRKLLRQPERISAMGRMSRHIAEAQYDAKRVNEGMLKSIVKSLQ